MPKLSQIPIDVSEWASLRQAVEWVAFNWLPVPEYLEIIHPKCSWNLFSWEQSLAVDRAKRSLFHAFVAADLVVMGREGYGTAVEDEDGEIDHTSYAPDYSRIDSQIWKLAPKITWDKSRCFCRISRSAAIQYKSWCEIRIKTSKLIKISPPDDLSIYDDHIATILKRMVSNGSDSICEDNSSETYVGAENRASDARHVAGESAATSMLGGPTTNLPSSQTDRIDPNNSSVSSAVTDDKSVAEDYPPYIRFLIRIYRELGEEVVNGSKKEELGEWFEHAGQPSSANRRRTKSARWPHSLGCPKPNEAEHVVNVVIESPS